MDILNKLYKILERNISLDLEICDGTLLSSLGINSLSFIKIVVEIEDEFCVSFSEDMMNLEKFSDVKSLSDYVCSIKR